MSSTVPVEDIVLQFRRCLYDAMHKCKSCGEICAMSPSDLDVVYALGCFLKKHWDKIFSYEVTHGEFRRTEDLRLHAKELAGLLINLCDPEDKEIWQKILDFNPPLVTEDGLIANVKITDNGELAFTRCGDSIKIIVDNLREFLSMAERGEYDRFDAELVWSIKFMAIKTLKNLKGFLKKTQLRQLQNSMSSLHIDIGQ